MFSSVPPPPVRTDAAVALFLFWIQCSALNFKGVSIECHDIASVLAQEFHPNSTLYSSSRQISVKSIWAYNHLHNSGSPIIPIYTEFSYCEQMKVCGPRHGVCLKTDRISRAVMKMQVFQ